MERTIDFMIYDCYKSKHECAVHNKDYAYYIHMLKSTM